jgi:hypothetical protein
MIRISVIALLVAGVAGNPDAPSPSLRRARRQGGATGRGWCERVSAHQAESHDDPPDYRGPSMTAAAAPGYGTRSSNASAALQVADDFVRLRK